MVETCKVLVWVEKSNSPLWHIMSLSTASKTCCGWLRQRWSDNSKAARTSLSWAKKWRSLYLHRIIPLIGEKMFLQQPYCISTDGEVEVELTVSFITKEGLQIILEAVIYFSFFVLSFVDMVLAFVVQLPFHKTDNWWWIGNWNRRLNCFKIWVRIECIAVLDGLIYFQGVIHFTIVIQSSKKMLEAPVVLFLLCVWIKFYQVFSCK